jgi:hypothetical protein
LATGKRTHRFQVLHFRDECFLHVQKLLQVTQLSAYIHRGNSELLETQLLTFFNVLPCASRLERHFCTSWNWNRVPYASDLITKTNEYPILFYYLQPEFTTKPTSIQLYSLQPEFTTKPKSNLWMRVIRMIAMVLIPVWDSGSCPAIPPATRSAPANSQKNQPITI